MQKWLKDRRLVSGGDSGDPRNILLDGGPRSMRRLRSYFGHLLMLSVVRRLGRTKRRRLKCRTDFADGRTAVSSTRPQSASWTALSSSYHTSLFAVQGRLGLDHAAASTLHRGCDAVHGSFYADVQGRHRRRQRGQAVFILSKLLLYGWPCRIQTF